MKKKLFYIQKLFHYFGQNKTFLLFYILATLTNMIILFITNDYILFIVRQCIWTLVFSLKKFLGNFFKSFQEEMTHINTILVSKHPLLKLEAPLFFLSIAYFYSLAVLNWEMNTLLSCIGIVSSIGFLFLYFYRLHTVYSIPEVRQYYVLPIKRSISLYKQSRSIYTAATILKNPTLKLCVECGKLLSVGVSFIGFSVGTPKLVYGFNHRPAVSNFVGYYFTGIKAETETTYSTALAVVEEYPDLKSKFVSKNGWVNGITLFNVIKEENLSGTFELQALKELILFSPINL